ncbi:serine--tRNA ligase [Helicobacter pylori]|uniref:serine--tRNA ligase n=1 Tax=Helicobacter pylori TaxID=210 RepID=UPI0003B2035C|nr:serine--tRNA ligase [Helicobacter pylori]ERM20567.1 seryl-tRNA synthetase [Helicobacter pylori CG-IMSS-2012]NHA53719.1 serine--tRNA ligase [Helicobacter pylori]WRC50214.1 serine--tRNA ligase [Helicobacter pylori]WRC55833.1 serine--tRNA ligase [Helicobacter pylori]WRC57279.1 serine--tRNA ligase [Helicobacter pylori]
MIDRKLLLQDFDKVALSLKKRNHAMDDGLERLCEVITHYKKQLIELEGLQAFQNKVSKEFGIKMAQKADASDLKKELENNKIKLNELSKSVGELEQQIDLKLSIIPNLVDEKTPLGANEEDNIEIKKILTPRVFNFKPKEHFELAQQNGWIDFESGVKLAKSRFSVIRGFGAKIYRALIYLMLDFNEKNGFEIIYTPALVNEKMLFGTGQLPKFKEDVFKIENENLYLIPTAEVTLTNLYNDTIISVENLPIKMTAHTPCFRSEAGSAGKDTRGMIRQHQFDKVELVAITHPKESDAMQECMLESASEILKALELPHRFVQLCSGDLGFSASNTIDIEVWLPGQNCYREISSVSNTRDFQARRAKIRFKENQKNQLAHTLNGSSLAVGRTMVALMENHQQADGSIHIPKALEKYL